MNSKKQPTFGFVHLPTIQDTRRGILFQYDDGYTGYGADIDACIREQGVNPDRVTGVYVLVDCSNDGEDEWWKVC